MTKNSIYSHLKLLSWRRTGPWLLRSLAASGAKTLLGRFAVWRGWWWNLRHLAQTLRTRRGLAKQRIGDMDLLVRRIEAHEQRQRHERRNPGQHGVGQCPACWSLTIEGADDLQRCFTCGFGFLSLPFVLTSHSEAMVNENVVTPDVRELDISQLVPQTVEALTAGLAIGQGVTITHQPSAEAPIRWTPLAARLTLERAGLTIRTSLPACLNHNWQGPIRAEKTS